MYVKGVLGHAGKCSPNPIAGALLDLRRGKAQQDSPSGLDVFLKVATDSQFWLVENTLLQ